MSEKEVCWMCSYGGILPLIVVVLVLFGGFYFLSTIEQPVINVSEEAPPEHTIDVSATASDYVNPDLLVLQLRVEDNGTTAKDSQSSVAKKTDAVKRALNELGIKDDKIKTMSYSVSEIQESHYICKNESSQTDCYWDYVTKGYKTTHVLKVEIENLAIGGNAVDSAITAGATSVDSISFTLKPATMDRVKNELLQRAASTARSKAQAIAAGAGVTLGKASQIAESYAFYPIYRNVNTMYESAGAPQQSTELYGGEMEVTATVTASFKIE